MKKGLDIRNEGPENLNDAKNSAKQASGSRLQEVAGKIEENNSGDTQTPNPKKAPLNYIENMGEWERTKKKYEEAIAQKQLELTSILSEYEDKGEELNRFMVAKTELEIKLVEIMGVISHKLMDHNDFMLGVYQKINENVSEGDEDDAAQGDEDDTTQGDDVDSTEVEYTEGEVADTEIQEDETGDTGEENGTTKINQIILASEDVMNILNSFGIDTSAGGEGIKGEFFDEVREIIDRFLFLMEPNNWKKYKRFLKKREILGVKKLYATLKKHYSKYMDLLHQIEIIDSKMEKLESEETNIGVNYLKGKKEAEDMTENIQKLSETYFLNSYLSTKNVSLDSFVSSPLVEKQIAYLIETNKKGQPLPKTILLYGKPNLGKTYAANVLASELGRTMYHIKSYDIFTGGFSDPNAMLDAIFNGVIKKKEPCIVFLDEIENFAQGYDGSPYGNLIENTIRHHISKIKESKLDIMVIGAISDKIKISPNLLKQDVFSKQIYFDTLPENRCVDFINKMAQEHNVTIGTDVDVAELVKNLKDTDQNQEFLKKLINMAIDFHKLNNGDIENITLSKKDFDEAVRYMQEYSRNISQGVGF